MPGILVILFELRNIYICATELDREKQRKTSPLNYGDGELF